MAEFLVALAVLLQLFPGISYLGRYGDLNQTATQASRYAAMQKAMHPGRPEGLTQDQMWARRLVHGSHRHGAQQRMDDSVHSVKNAKGHTALWLDLSDQPPKRKPDRRTPGRGDQATLLAAMGPTPDYVPYAPGGQ